MRLRAPVLLWIVLRLRRRLLLILMLVARQRRSIGRCSNWLPSVLCGNSRGLIML